MRIVAVAVFLFLAILFGLALLAMGDKAASEGKREAERFSRGTALGLFAGAVLGLVFLIQEILR